ncbi:TonB family protein [Spirosoma sp. SC4-14]|uniref:TonB family protein n=1 Tax=Spirosoma sp. SC4-14 TaxID=3128900 RepID=UPI0030D36412
MKFILPFCLLFSAISAFSQQTPYQAFEVDSVAEPRGSMVYFNTFLQANLRKPITAEAQGIGGRVIVSGVVEPNGTITDVKVINKISPDCDREAARVFALFNAWKPAYKGGQAVRQLVSMPILFRANEPFMYQNGVKIEFFNAEYKPLFADSSQAIYKRITPLDTNYIPTGDAVVYERKAGSWKEYFRLAFFRKKQAVPDSPTKSTYLIGTQTYKQDWVGPLLIVDEDTKRVSEEHYTNGKLIGSSLTYHPNGLVIKKVDDVDGKSTEIAWYANGQIKHIKTINKNRPLLEPERVTALWDSTGQQTLKNGTGRVIYKTRENSYSDTAQYTAFIEEGNYENGFKQGLWTGRYADGSYYYEELYDKGICQGGKAKSAKEDTVHYEEVLKEPQFPDGMPGLGKFLSSNLHYPSKAQKANVEGKVFISFVVCTDGTLCDYEVLKSVQQDLDAEALRVVKKMSGKWLPGYHRGQKARVKYNLPINFTLY